MLRLGSLCALVKTLLFFFALTAAALAAAQAATEAPPRGPQVTGEELAALEEACYDVKAALEVAEGCGFRQRDYYKNHYNPNLTLEKVVEIWNEALPDPLRRFRLHQVESPPLWLVQKVTTQETLDTAPAQERILILWFYGASRPDGLDRPQTALDAFFRLSLFVTETRVRWRHRR